MSEKERDSFVFYRSFYNSAGLIPKKYRLQFLETVILYALDGVKTDFSKLPPMIRDLFGIALENITPTIDKSQKRYADCVNNGKKGGNPNFKKGQSNPYYNKGKKGQKTDEDNQKDNRGHNQRDNQEDIQEHNRRDNQGHNQGDNLYKDVDVDVDVEGIAVELSTAIPDEDEDDIGRASPPAEVGVSASAASKLTPGGLTEEELELARKLMPRYE